MSAFVPWNSQPLDEWVEKYARGEILDVDGYPMHYVERGAGDPVILIHGFFFDTNMWNNSIDVLAERYKVYAIDLWGFGFSTREHLDYGYPLYAMQLKKFMDAMKIEKASLIGQSMGGGTIIKFSISNPERVDKVVLVNTAGMPNPLPMMGKISNLPGVGELMYALPGSFIRKFTLGNNFLYRKELITDELYNQVTNFHKIKNSSAVMLKVTRALFFDTLMNEIQDFSRLDIPTLIVWGKQEKSIPLPIGKQLAKILAKAKFVALDQAGHCSNMDQPEHFNKLVQEHLADE